MVPDYSEVINIIRHVKLGIHQVCILTRFAEIIYNLLWCLHISRYCVREKVEELGDSNGRQVSWEVTVFEKNIPTEEA